MKKLLRFLGVPSLGQHAGEQTVATIGGIVSILTIMSLTMLLLGREAAVIVVPSMGASTVIVFAVPHSPFAQPWSLLGGNVLSALVGVACQQWVPQPMWAAALAVGGAIAVMHVTRTLHPPGGATALAAVIGGPTIHELGFAYALTPVALNCLIMIIVGMIFNGFFAWRRYPLSMMRFASVSPGEMRAAIGDEHIREAIDHLNLVVDIGENELRSIVDHAVAAAARDARAALPRIELGKFYSNGRPGQQWSVRQVIDERRSADPLHDLVIYKVVDGEGLHRTGSCTREEFARWVVSELQPHR